MNALWTPTTDALTLCLRIVALAQILLAGLSLTLPRILDWKPDIARMSLLVREVFEIHSWFIALTLVIWGVLTWQFAPEMAAHTSPLTSWLCAAIGFFLALRTVLQWSHYSASHWRGNTPRTVIHWTLTFGYGAWAVVYFLAAFRK
jgi:hypothetical protein